MKLAYTLDACTDCVSLTANGDIPDETPDLAKLIAAHLGLSPGQHIVNADDGEDWFSWSPCECCGRSFGGTRNRLAVLECE